MLIIIIIIICSAKSKSVVEHYKKMLLVTFLKYCSELLFCVYVLEEYLYGNILGIIEELSFYERECFVLKLQHFTFRIFKLIILNAWKFSDGLNLIYFKLMNQPIFVRKFYLCYFIKKNKVKTLITDRVFLCFFLISRDSYYVYRVAW